MTDAPPARRAPMRSVLLFLRDVLVIFGIAILVSFLVKTFLVRSFFIPSASMEQTLMIDDRVIVNELVPKAVAVDHGDIVVFKDPGGWLPARPPVEVTGIQAGTEWVLSLFGLASPDSNDHLIKRVIGLPGDTVQCCSADGKIMVNGVAITEPYITIPAGETRASAIDFNVTVPESSLFVMGDNRYNSKDSRYNTDKPGGGFVGMDNVVGRAFVLSWPMSHWGWLSNYPEVFADVPEPATSK
ncbi:MULTISPECIES: signal peptidase I [Aurantimicrobium]|uniref:Signal peptidase I n=3 Tax=Aurantimicrobium TaxID=1705353 RepID=A0A2Z3RWI7_9MICO|nr:MULTISPECIES: signal peptidase I [Aurantimicrobium]AWR21207.1 Signal peptidase I [Aurantimicrobium photophilum]MDF9809228.1 signal peptidase I [Aurantimicrobium minutum]